MNEKCTVFVDELPSGIKLHQFLRQDIDIIHEVSGKSYELIVNYLLGKSYFALLGECGIEFYNDDFLPNPEATKKLAKILDDYQKHIEKYYNDIVSSSIMI